VAEYDKELLQGRWVHSFEEDTDDEMVFRPADREFPPARGRESFELRPDGTYAGSAPGPVDVPEHTEGAWSLEHGQLVLDAGANRSTRLLEIAGAEKDRLTIRK
jgi:hypothetical protein